MNFQIVVRESYTKNYNRTENHTILDSEIPDPSNKSVNVWQ